MEKASPLHSLGHNLEATIALILGRIRDSEPGRSDTYRVLRQIRLVANGTIFGDTNPQQTQEHVLFSAWSSCCN